MDDCQPKSTMEQADPAAVEQADHCTIEQPDPLRFSPDRSSSAFDSDDSDSDSETEAGSPPALNDSTKSPSRTLSPEPSSQPGGKLAQAVSDVTDSFRDREQKAIADLLSRFKNIVSLIAIPEGEGAESLELAAAQSFQVEVETASLIRAAEDLLQLTREMKEAWLFGPLRGLGEGEEDDKMAEDARKVAEKVDEVTQKLGKASVKDEEKKA